MATENPFARWEATFREQMVRLRELRGMTQTDLAKWMRDHDVPFHQQTVQKIEAGDRPVRLNEAHLIAEALEVELGSMTSVAREPTMQSVRFSIDRLRRVSGLTVQDYPEVTSDWIEAVAGLAVDLDDQVSVEGLSATPLLAATAAWARACERTLYSYVNFVYGMESIGPERRISSFEPADETLHSDLRHLLDRADAVLAAKHPALSSKFLSELPPAVLYQLTTSPELPVELPINDWTVTLDDQRAVMAFLKAGQTDG